MHARAITAMLTLSLGLLPGGPARAGEAVEAQGATAAIKGTVDKVLAVLGDPAMKGPAHVDARRARMREVVLQRFSFDEMAQRSLGPDWSARSAAERTEYVKLFTDLLARSYIARVEAYTGEPIRYDRESLDGDHAEVQSTILQKAGDRTIIQYRLRRIGSTWHVYDLIIDGVSLVNNYRTQFGRIIRQSGFRGLIGKMRDKLETERSEEHALEAPRAP